MSTCQSTIIWATYRSVTTQGREEQQDLSLKHPSLRVQRNAKPQGEFVRWARRGWSLHSWLHRDIECIWTPPITGDRTTPPPLPSTEAAATDEPCHFAFTEGVCVRMRNGAQWHFLSRSLVLNGALKKSAQQLHLEESKLHGELRHKLQRKSFYL